MVGPLRIRAAVLMTAMVVAACGRGATSARARPSVVDVGQARGQALEPPPDSVSCRVDGELARLTQPMKIEAFLPGGTPALEAFTRDVRARLDGYRKASRGQVEIRHIDTDAAEGRARAKEADFPELVLGDGETGYSGLTIAYGSERGSIRALRPDSTVGLDYQIVSKLRETREASDGVHHELGVLVGHGERTFADSSLLPSGRGQPPTLAGIAQQYFRSYRFNNVDLQGGAAEVPASLEGLIVLAPERDLSSAELARLDAFVMRGKSLLVFGGAAHVDAEMKASLRTPPLAALLAGYGIDVHDDLVLDHDRGFVVNVNDSNGSSSLRFPAVLRVFRSDGELDAMFLPFFRIEEAGFSYTSSVSLSPSRQPSAHLRLVAHSSSRATIEHARNVDLGIGKSIPAQEPFAKVGLAAAATGRLRSAFDAPPSERPARVAVFASPSFLANPFVDPKPREIIMGTPISEPGDAVAMPYIQVMSSSLLPLFKNILDWMVIPDELAACSASK